MQKIIQAIIVSMFFSSLSMNSMASRPQMKKVKATIKENQPCFYLEIPEDIGNKYKNSQIEYTVTIYNSDKKYNHQPNWKNTMWSASHTSTLPTDPKSCIKYGQKTSGTLYSKAQPLLKGNIGYEMDVEITNIPDEGLRNTIDAIYASYICIQRDEKNTISLYKSYTNGCTTIPYL